MGEGYFHIKIPPDVPDDVVYFFEAKMYASSACMDGIIMKFVTLSESRSSPEYLSYS